MFLCVKAAPFAFTLLGERLVLWWDHKDGAWSAMRDVCPHRLAPLSEGRINDQVKARACASFLVVCQCFWVFVCSVIFVCVCIPFVFVCVHV